MKSKLERELIKGISILVVDDEVEIRDIIRNSLLRKFETVYSAENGEKGLELYKLYKPDIIVSDINMPRMDGLEMSKAIKAIDNETTIIISTAYESSEALLKAINLGITHYIIKPIAYRNLLKLIMDIVDIKFQKRRADEANQLLDQYKTAVDVSSILSKTNPQGIITFVNEQFCKLSGYESEELIGRPHNIVRHPDMPREAFKELWETIKNKQTWKGIVKNRAKDGHTYIVDATIIPILDNNGEIKEFIGIRHDITELENYKQILKEQLDVSAQGLDEKIKFLKEYQRAIDVSTSFSRTDIHGTITYVNERFCQVSGYSRDELIGRNHNLVRHPDVKSEIYANLWQKIKSKNIWQGVLKNRAKSGKAYYMDTTIIPILDVNDEIVEFISIRHDVTETVELNHEIEATQKEVVFTMGAIGETRSKETGNHVRRVAEYSKLLALKYGLDEEEAELIKLASPMHDIGKVGIPDAILNKPAKLTEDEFKIMQRHAELGYEMLKNSNRPILKTSSIIAYQHHEKWDGSGYPQKLKAEEIHLYGRITAIADVFDALGSDRCYKKAWELERILNLFKEESGKHFDPKLVEILFANLDGFLEIRDRYKDEL